MARLTPLSKLLLAGNFSQDYAWKSVTLLNLLYEAVQTSSTLSNSEGSQPDSDPVLRQLNATCQKLSQYLDRRALRLVERLRQHGLGCGELTAANLKIDGLGHVHRALLRVVDGGCLRRR